MLKYLRYILVIIPHLLWCYFAWMIKYARHPQRYPLEKRYNRIRKLVLFTFRHFRIQIISENEKYFTEAKTPFVLYANHYSDLDPLLLVALSKRPITFVAKKETLKFPFIGKVVKILEGVTIDRANLRSQIIAIDAAVKMIEDGHNVVIFPEGTRTRNPDLMIGEFKPGAFKLSYRTGASIIPCALYGTFRPLSTKTNLKINPIWIKFFDPIEKNDFLQINTVNMAPMVQGMIQQEITNNMKVRDADFVTNLKNKKSK